VTDGTERGVPLTGVVTAGFEVIRGVLGDAEVETLRLAASAFTRSRAGARHLMQDAHVRRLAQDRRLVELASAALDSPAEPYRATLFEKTASANWLVVWHQDTALPLERRREVEGWGPWSTKEGVEYAQAPASALERIVALRVHLDDSTPENGPLRVIPGSHTLGVLSDAAIRDLGARQRPHECIVARGGILVMRPLLVHASSKSAVPAPRRVLHIEYASTFCLEPGLILQVA
jgi:ectoine hydroxylase-related dioxygenase (phytanoyl-CoA dioxygenase family)